MYQSNSSIQTKTKTSITHSALGVMCLVFTVFTVSACGSSGDSDGASDATDMIEMPNTDEAPANTDGPDSADGTTTDASLLGSWERCDGSDTQTLKRVYTFTADRYTSARTDYSNGNCSGLPIFTAGVSGGYYEIVGDSISESGLAVKQINMTRDRIDDDIEAVENQLSYNGIYYTGTPNTLYLALTFAEFDRPTELDFDFFYVRP